MEQFQNKTNERKRGSLGLENLKCRAAKTAYSTVCSCCILISKQSLTNLNSLLLLFVRLIRKKIFS